jgi:hypothetical protein
MKILKLIAKFFIDLFEEPKCKTCGEYESNVGGGGISPEPLYVCLNRKCKDNSCI